MSAPLDPAQPLVSVLIRSLDRPLLQEALDSLAAQTWARLEVIVAPARPAHSPVPEQIGPHPLRVLPTDRPWLRSANANRLLKAAQGAYLLFLDDDDWLMPDHITRLVHALQCHPQTLAAYTGVAKVDAVGCPMGQVFDLPWDATRLISGNLMPIHAVLFRAELLDKGCAFDEGLDRFEDWDFWLQVARRTLFVHVPGVSAVYRIHESSGVHQESCAEGDHSASMHAQWLSNCSARERADLMRRAWAFDDAVLQRESSERFHSERWQALQVDLARLLQVNAQQLTELTQAHHQLAQERAVVAQQSAELARLGDQLEREHADLMASRHRVDGLTLDLQSVHSSTSWRVTAPLRWLATLFQHRS